MLQAVRSNIIARLPDADPGSGAEQERVSLKRVNLKVENLCCERNDRLLFSDVSFELNPGELVQVDGSNGSGKTTLLRTICGLRQPQAGRVLWCGHPIEGTRVEFLSELAYVGHKHGVKDDLTVRENLQIDRLLSAGRSTLSEQEALERLGLGVCAEQLCRQLSAGQRQRVALSRVLMGAATLWVLDEPLTALDVRAQSTLRELLFDHVRNNGMVLISSHQELGWPEQFKRVRLGDV